MNPSNITKILSIIEDYRKHDGVALSANDIEEWALQFGEDADFILSELAHILPQTYISKAQAKSYVKSNLNSLYKKFDYKDVGSFLEDTYFFDTQDEHKSQKAILGLLEEVLLEKGHKTYRDYLEFPKKNFVYFDDLLASGGTFRRDIIQGWLFKDDKKNAKEIDKKSIKFVACFFTVHTWALALLRYEIAKKLGEKTNSRLKFVSNVFVENNLGEAEQRLNAAIPIKNFLSPTALKYFASLAANKHEKFAFRPAGSPKEETFFPAQKIEIAMSKFF